jgi:hypothetical protein
MDMSIQYRGYVITRYEDDCYYRGIGYRAVSADGQSFFDATFDTLE